MGGPSYHHVRKAHMYLRLLDSSLPLGRNLDLKYIKFSLKYSNFTMTISSIESHQDWLRPRITYELLQDWLHTRTTYKTDYVWATYELHQDFMLRQLVSPTMLELITPSFEISWSGSHTGASLLLSASYKKIQVRSIKSTSSFQKKHTTSQISEQVATYFASAVLSAMQDYFLLNQEITLDLILKQHPKMLFLSMALRAKSEST